MQKRDTLDHHMATLDHMDRKPHTGAIAPHHGHEPAALVGQAAPVGRAAPVGHPEAIVRPVASSRRIRVERVAPRPELAHFVDYFWIVRWETSEPYEQQVVPQPRVHIAAEAGRLLVHGLNREPFVRRLVGRGHTIGAAFRAGGFRPMLLASARAGTGTCTGVGSLSGRVVPASEVLGFDDAAVASAIAATEDSADMVAVFEDALLGCDARRDPLAERLDELVGYAERTRSLTRAEQIADVAGVSMRTLQRQFTEVIGIGPKWVIQRFRLLDVAAAIVGDDASATDADAAIDWADLAVTLGFSDQSHLIRVFTSVVGTPPARYAGDPGTR
ncbi:AraC family transcriptional regulator [Plantibacter sp. YIM 135347]|uniref:AraC family transcriptional regulator n=1 Tax=Plantibacter sp. YIM 135347 TaxID=3423919 RepID=UPI003D350CB4